MVIAGVKANKSLATWLTPHEDKDGSLRCSQCVPPAAKLSQASGADSRSRLRVALTLFVDHPHAANCFFVHTVQLCLKFVVFFGILLGAFERGLFVSVVMIAVGFFAIKCFGPHGKDKALAVEFRKRFWTTLVPR
jgi:hypothetical protein